MAEVRFESARIHGVHRFGRCGAGIIARSVLRTVCRKRAAAAESELNCGWCGADCQAALRSQGVRERAQKYAMPRDAASTAAHSTIATIAEIRSGSGATLASTTIAINASF